MKSFQQMNLRRILFVTVAVLLLCGSMAGMLVANAWNTTGTYRLLQFNENSAERSPTAWMGGDVNSFGDGNFAVDGGPDNNGSFQAIFNTTQDLSANPINDPYVGLKTTNTLGLDYTVKAGDVIQVCFRFRDVSFKSGSENVRCSKMYFAGTGIHTDKDNKAVYTEDYIVELTKPDWTHNNYQWVTGTVPSSIVGKELDFVRFDPLDAGSKGGAFSLNVGNSSGFYIDYIYIGDAANTPYKKVTYSYKNASAAATTSVEWVKKGNKPVSVPSITTPVKESNTATTQYVWNNKWSSKTVADVMATTINSDTTFTADYITQYQVSFKYINETNNAWNTESVWINKDSTPGNKVPTPPTNPQTVGTNHVRRRFTDKWNGLTTASVKTTKITGPITFTAEYVFQWRIQYQGYRSNFSTVQDLHEEWVDEGQKPDDHAKAATELINTAGNQKYVLYKITRQTTNNGVTNNEYFESLTDAFNIAVDQNMLIMFNYTLQHRVRYFKSNLSTQLESDQWIEDSAKPTAPTAEAVSGKTFVAWTQGKNGTAVVPTNTSVTAPIDYYPRYLSNAFVGSSTNSIVASRTVTLKEGTTNATHQYTIRLDVYNYGEKLDGYMKIMDNLKEDFAVISDLKVIRVPYLGNGKFKDENMTSTQLHAAANEKDADGKSIDTDGIIYFGNGGNHAYVNDLRINENKTGANVWLKAMHKDGQENIDHHYYCMHLYEEGYEDNYGEAINKADAANRKVQNSEAYKSNAYLREVSKGSGSTPYGYKLVMIFDIELERDGTIGGNNLPLSHATEHAVVEYYSTLSEKKNPTRTINLSDVCTTKYTDEKTKETVTSKVWPNANVEILYDFCPHDYYMDLYDVQKTHFISRGKMEGGSNFVQPGIITVLRKQAAGNNGDNNYLIYGGMFTHGNAPVYVREEKDENAYNLYGLPNTDCNGVRNEKVRITYSVKHNGTGKVVYQTVCEPYSSSFRAITTSDPEGVDGKHNEIKVDFLQDHSVTITATVTPVHTAHTDSFGRGTLATTWSKTAQSYYFAPRIAVMDTSNNIGIPLQDEVAAAGNFIAAPSVMYALDEDGGYRTVAANRVSGIANPATMEEKELRWCFRKDTTNGYTYEMASQNAQVLQGIQTITYTTQAINTPKRFTATDTMANRDKVVRNAYFIPSTCITYDQNALSFDTIANWKLDGRVSQAFQYYDLYKGLNGTDRYGFDGDWHAELRTSAGDLVDRRGNGMDYNGGTLYTNVGATDTNPRNEWGIFTFTGTGFDLYSRNGPETGVIVAQVYEGELTIGELTNDKLVQNIFADTYLPETTYYQVPSIQWRATDANNNLKHGTYTVRFRAYYHEAFDHQLYTKSAASKAIMTEERICDIMGWDSSVPCTISLSDAAYPALTRATKNSEIEPEDYDVYIDGIRVYNTLGTNLQQASGNVLSTNDNAMQYAAYAIYNRDNEVNAKYFNVSELLVDAANRPAWNGGDADGVFYIAADQTTTDATGTVNGMFIGMSGEFRTKSVDFKDAYGNTYKKIYFLDEEGNILKEKKTGTNIFSYSLSNTYFLETTDHWYELKDSEISTLLTGLKGQIKTESAVYYDSNGNTYTKYYFLNQQGKRMYNPVLFRSSKDNKIYTEKSVWTSIMTIPQLYELLGIDIKAVDYTDESGSKFVKYYFLDADGKYIIDPETEKNIFQYSRDNKYYIETTEWTNVTLDRFNELLSPVAKIRVEARNYTETGGSSYIKYYFLDKDGKRIIDPSTYNYIFQYSKDNKYYIEVQEQTVLSNTQLNQRLGLSSSITVEEETYTDSNGKECVKCYFLDKDGNRITDPDTGYAIFMFGEDYVYYSDNTWTKLTNNELSLALDNRIVFYGDKYDTIGPEFEIYLAEGNGVAFNVCDANNLSSLKAVHISLRCGYTDIENQAAPLVEVFDGNSNSWVRLQTSYGADHHELYYDVTKYAKYNNGNIYLRNGVNEDGKICYLSVMNVKLIGGKAPSVNTRMLIEAMDLIRGEAETPVLDEGLDLKHSLNLASDISINYVVPATSMEGVQSSFLMVEVPQYEGNELIGTKTVRINPAIRNSMYYYVLEDLSAIHMNDEMKATLHVIKNGEHFISAEDRYSIAAYAYTQLNKDSSSEALKTLCANLLRYGSTAQTFKGYRTDFLADEELSQEHQAYLTDLDTVSFSTTNVVLKDLESPSVLWKGKSLVLNSKVSVKFLIDPTNYEGDAESLSLRVTYLNGNGEEEIVILTESELYSDNYPYRAFEFDGLLAAELRTVLSAAVYDGDTQVSATAQYAADAYGNGKTGDLLLVCKALFAYSDAAKAFFTVY